MKMKQFIISLLIAMAIGGAQMASAQGCGDAPSDDGVQVFGFLQAQYETKFEEETTGSFAFERARIGVQGLIPYDFSYYVVVEYSPFISTNPYLLDAFVSYSRFDWARVSVGSFKSPFGLEINTPCNGLVTIYRSTASLQMVAPFRDMGMVIMGGNKETKLAYQLGVMNGSGLGRLDNNKKKDVVGRVLYRPLDFLQIGGSFRYGFPSYNNNDDSRTTFGGELKATYEGFTLMGEYIMDEGDYNRDLGGGCGGELINLGKERSGGWASISYLTKWNVEPVFKFDFFDSGNSEDYKETNMTFGVNYFLNDWTRLQANYIYRMEDPTDFDNDRFVIQIQAKF
jgi:phosphate-selective porin OprO and OprP